VQKLLQKKNELKDWMKRDGRTITSYEGTQLHDEYDKKKQAYEREYEFQKKAFLNELKKKFEKEQAVIDIQNQIHGLELKMNDLATDTDKVLLPKRLRAIDALFAFATSSPEEERSRRVRVVDMLVALGQMQDGHQYPVRRRKRRVLAPIPPPSDCISLECKPLQCFLCCGNTNAPTHQRTREFHSRGDLKRHLLRFHAKKQRGSGPIVCPIDGEALSGAQHVLSHGHRVHKTPTMLCR